MTGYHSAADKERRHIGLQLAKEHIFREAAEEMLAVLPQVANVPTIEGPKSILVRSGFMGWDGKKESPDFIKKWAADTSKGWVTNEIARFVDQIGYDFGHMGAASLWKHHRLSEKFYKDFEGASYYASLDAEKVKALGYNGVAIIVQSKLQAEIGNSTDEAMKNNVDAKAKQRGEKVETLGATYRHMAQEAIRRIDDYRMKKAEALYRPEPVPEVA